MSARPAWDLLVVGGGTAGIVGAQTAAGFGARVLLVERDRTGGDCLWTGCVPSKALLAAAGRLADARAAAKMGITAGSIDVDFAAVLAHVHAAIETIAPVDSPAALEAANVTVRAGHLRFTGPGLATVDGDPVHFRQALLATGAAPTLPPIPGLDEIDALTSDSVWDLTSLPARLAVLGGGSIGSELGQGLARLGSEVTLVEGEDRLLPREDPDAAAAVHRALEEDGVRLRVGTQVTGVRRDGAGGAGHLDLADGSRVAFDRLLVVVGRTPRTRDLGLDTVGVELDDRGFVVVDEHLRSTHPRIWAAGDLTGHPQFTHTAGVHASVAASNAILGLRRTVDTDAVPRVTYTSPEVAAVGLDTADPGPGRRVLEWSHTHVDRAVAEADTGGRTKLVVDRRGRILGATVVGPRAGETLGELGLAVSRGLRTQDLAAVTHAYPTWNDGAWQAAISDVQRKLKTPVVSTAMGVLMRTRRWWVTRRPEG